MSVAVTTGHTPGPWTVGDETLYNPGQLRIVNGPGGIAIALAQRPFGDNGITYEGRDANAHLIAAAPDMLEALREAWEELAQIPNPDAVLQSVKDRVHNAIMKATAR